MNDPKQDARPPTEADPDGRDHAPGLAGAATREDVDKDERFANSRKDGVIDEHGYLDDLGDAVASTLGGLVGAGEETDAKIDDERRDRDPEAPRPSNDRPS